MSVRVMFAYVGIVVFYCACYECILPTSSSSPSSSSSSTIIQVLMKFMEMMSPDTEYLQQLTKKLAPPLGNNPLSLGGLTQITSTKCTFVK